MQSYVVTSYFWQIIAYWQPLIAGAVGVLAFAAVLWQTYVTRAEAEKQVKSVVDQTNELKRQNLALQNENRRQLAREKLNASTLLVSAVTQMQNDITAAERQLENLDPIPVKADDIILNSKMEDVGERKRQNAMAVVAGQVKSVRYIYKPSLDVVWNSLGVCSTEIIEKYLELDAEVIKFGRADAVWGSLQVKQLQKLALHLKIRLIDQIKQCKDELEPSRYDILKHPFKGYESVREAAASLASLTEPPTSTDDSLARAIESGDLDALTGKVQTPQPSPHHRERRRVGPHPNKKGQGAGTTHT